MNRPVLPSVAGPIHAVPCPNCGRQNDFRDLEQQSLLDTGHDIWCDHCGRLMETVAIRQETIITVRKSQSAAVRPPDNSPKQAATISPTQAKKLLR